MKRILLLIFVTFIFSLPTYAQELKEPNLYVFVGEKISVEQFEPELEEGVIMMDKSFRARFKVLKPVYNNLPADTLEFLSYVHLGEPLFSHFEHSIIFVIKSNEGYIHARYLSSPVYKTENGKWAVPYDATAYNHQDNNTNIVPERIDWKTHPKFDAGGIPSHELHELYPPPFYKVKGDTAIAVYGNYLWDLFLLRKHTVLKARGYFTDS